MICNATSYRRGPFKPLAASDQTRQSQAFILRAEVIDTTDKIHSQLQGLTLSGQGTRASGQAEKAAAKGSVVPLDDENEGCVDVAFPLRLLNHLSDRFFCHLINLLCHAYHSIVLILFDHLRDQNVGPFAEATSSCILTRLFLAKGILK
jgi:hypothetical protein